LTAWVVVAPPVTWQDDRVPHPDQPVQPGRGLPAARTDLASRRVFLRGLLGVTGVGVLGAGSLAGCDIFGSDSAPPTEATPPALSGFLNATVALGDQYDAALATVDSLPATVGQIRDAHRAHAKALAKAIGVATPSAKASPTGGAPATRDEALAALVAAEKTGHDQAETECLKSPPRFAALLGSIAAARATHLVGLA
jgi:hypothetical protein